MAWKKNAWTDSIADTRKSEGNPSKPRRRNPMLAGMAAAGIVVLGALLAWMLWGDSSPVKTPQDVPSPKTRSARKALPVSQTRTSRTDTATNAQVVATPPVATTNEFVQAPGTLQLPDGRVLRFPAPREGEYRIVHSHGKTYKCDHLGNWEDVTPKPVFDNAFEENLIGLSVEGGHFMPGMLMGLDPKGVMTMLQKQVVINSDDPEDVVEKKKAVAEAKAAILDYIAEGGTFDQFVAEMRELSVKERKVKSTAMRDIVSLLKEGRVDDAAYYRKVLDDQLGKEGFKPIKLPSHITQILSQAKEPVVEAGEKESK